MMGSLYIRASNMSATHRLLHKTTHSINSFNSSLVPHSYNSWSVGHPGRVGIRPPASLRPLCLDSGNRRVYVRCLLARAKECSALGGEQLPQARYCLSMCEN